MPKLNFFVLILSGIMFGVADSMRCDLQSGECISEDIKSDAMTVGQYNVVNPKDGFPIPDTHKINVEMMEFQLKKPCDTARLIHDEMFYLRGKEEGTQQLDRVANLKVTMFSFLSLVGCLSVAGLQLWHLKTFSERKKLL